MPVVYLVATRWWKAEPRELGVARPAQGSFGWVLKFTVLICAGYLVLGAAALLVRYAALGWFTAAELHRYARGAKSGLTSHGGPFAFAFAGIVVAPLVEELLFRGILYRSLRAKMRMPLAILVSAVVFAAIHPVWSGRLYVPVTQFLGGLIFAALYEKTRSLLWPAIFHAAGNAAILAWQATWAYRSHWFQHFL